MHFLKPSRLEPASVFFGTELAGASVRRRHDIIFSVVARVLSLGAGGVDERYSERLDAAFGSCNKQHVAALLVGDCSLRAVALAGRATRSTRTTRASNRSAPRSTRSAQPEARAFVAASGRDRAVVVDGVWDDHDLGINDAGANNVAAASPPRGATRSSASLPRGRRRSVGRLRARRARRRGARAGVYRSLAFATACACRCSTRAVPRRAPHPVVRRVAARRAGARAAHAAGGRVTRSRPARAARGGRGFGGDVLASRVGVA